MNTVLKFPFYAKASLFLIGFYISISILSIAQDLFLPLIYATISAILLSPVVNYLVKKKINRAVSITCVLIIALLIVSCLIALLSSQASLLREAWPDLTNKFELLLNQTIHWASSYFNISSREINKWIATTKSELNFSSSALIGTTLTTLGGVLATTVLTPVYIFMLLFYQSHLVEFIHRLFGTKNNNNVNEILTETKTVIQSYLSGLFAEFIIVAIMNITGLLILGIEYAILLGLVGALLNVIPYLGGAITIVLFMIIALVTKSPIYIFYVLTVYTFIQFVDNNYIVPKIVGSKVKLNALTSLIAVVAGGILWGIPGMFLSIPLIAILKIIFDHIDPLKAWGFLLGNITPVTKQKSR